MTGIYVHIPFCASKCAYCDFASFSCGDKEKYFEHLINEIKSSQHAGRAVDTIYFGGGTPSFVNASFIENVLKTLKNIFKIDKNAEITIECNPNSATDAKLKAYKKMGFNRISLGIQSFNDKQLKAVGRIHNSKDVFDAIARIKNAGFENISGDLIVGLPHSDEFSASLEAGRMIAQGLSHVSVYMLQLEKGTPLYKMSKHNPHLFPCEDEVAERFDVVSDALQRQGYKRYEVSNFALPGKESRHNIKYWSGEDYLGFGLSATSTVGDKRWTNGDTFEKYFAGKRKYEKIGKQEKIEEKIMLGLRCFLGFDKEEVKALGYDINSNRNFQLLKEQGILKEENGRVKLKEEYYNLNNSVITKLMP